MLLVPLLVWLYSIHCTSTTAQLVDYGVYFNTTNGLPNPFGQGFYPQSQKLWNFVEKPSYPIFLDWGVHLGDPSKWNAGNRCQDRSSATYSTAHNQSPIRLQEDSKCGDQHRTRVKDPGQCAQNEVRFYTTPYGLGVDTTKCSRYWKYDHARNPDPWFLQEIRITTPSEHTVKNIITGGEIQYAGELQLAFKGSAGHKAYIAITGIFLALSPTDESNAEIEKLLVGWETYQNNVYKKCNIGYDNKTCKLVPIISSPKPVAIPKKPVLKPVKPASLPMKPISRLPNRPTLLTPLRPTSFPKKPISGVPMKPVLPPMKQAVPPVPMKPIPRSPIKTVLPPMKPVAPVKLANPAFPTFSTPVKTVLQPKTQPVTQRFFQSENRTLDHRSDVLTSNLAFKNHSSHRELNDECWMGDGCPGSYYCFPDLFWQAPDAQGRYRHWRYSGSLTYPPCTENVDWRVLFGTLNISKNQLDRIEALIHKHLDPVKCTLATVGSPRSNSTLNRCPCCVNTNRMRQSLSIKMDLEQCNEWATSVIPPTLNLTEFSLSNSSVLPRVRQKTDPIT